MSMRAAWWWVDRWRRSTAYTRLTLEEQGAYRNLLDELWLRDGVLENDDRYLANVSGDATRWPEIRERVMAFFVLSEAGWTNPTHDEIAGESKRRAEKQKRYRDRKRGVTAAVTSNEVDNKVGSPSPSPSPSKRHITDRDQTAVDAWDEIKRILKATVPSHSWSTWIRPTEGWGWIPDIPAIQEYPDRRRVLVLCPPGQHLLHISENYGNRITKLVEKRGFGWQIEEASLE